MKKFSKEWLEAKKKGREAIDAGEQSAPVILDGTVGHEEGPVGTWNTSGVELPVNTGAVRDVRPETSDAVSLEGLRELGVPVRSEADFVEGPTPAEKTVVAETRDAKVREANSKEAKAPKEAKAK